MYEKYIKRLLDFLLSLLALIILCPLLIVLTVTGAVAMGGNPFFTQPRPGRDEKIFKLIKFRSMSNKKDKDGRLLPDAARLNRYGRFIRNTSLDELGELLNILKGDMSLVGPRPQLIRDMVFMTQEQRKRHAVRPGLTGLAQINGRNNISWEEKFEYDLEYIRKITFAGDCRIVFRTIGKVLNGSDTVRDGTASDLDFGDYLLDKRDIDLKEYEARQEEAKILMESNKLRRYGKCRKR